MTTPVPITSCAMSPRYCCLRGRKFMYQNTRDVGSQEPADVTRVLVHELPAAQTAIPGRHCAGRDRYGRRHGRTGRVAGKPGPRAPGLSVLRQVLGPAEAVRLDA